MKGSENMTMIPVKEVTKPVGRQEFPEFMSGEIDAGGRDKLTLKQWRFVREYVRTGNATVAYGNAGYAGTPKQRNSNASHLMKKPKIQRAIQEEIKKMGLAGEEVLTPDEVLVNLTEIAMNPNSSEPAKLKALELLGKRYRLFTDKVDESQGREVLIELE